MLHAIGIVTESFLLGIVVGAVGMYVLLMLWIRLFR